MVGSDYIAARRSLHEYIIYYVKWHRFSMTGRGRNEKDSLSTCRTINSRSLKFSTFQNMIFDIHWSAVSDTFRDISSF